MTVSIPYIVRVFHLLLMALSPASERRHELEDTFRGVVAGYDNMIMRLCFGYAGSSAELEDLHQDALTNIWRGLPSYRADASLKTWIYRVTLNTCVSTLRSKASRGKSLPLEDALAFTDCEAEQRERLMELHQGISMLSPLDKSIVEMWLDGLSYDEIASLTGLTRNAVGTRFHRAKGKLRRLFE